MKSPHLLTSAFLWLLLSLSFNAHGGSPTEQNPVVTAAPENVSNSSEVFEQDSVLKTQEDKINYAIGVQLIGNFKRQGIDINLDLVTLGMRDALSGGPLLLPEGEIRKLIMTYQEQAVRNLAKARRVEAETSKKQGLSFLEENKRKEGVVAVESGLQLIKLKNGDGPKPVQSDTVELTYRGTLIDGTEFERSKDGQPVQMKIGSMLPGLQEALKHMPVGSLWKVVVPAHLGYGPRGNGSTVGPHSVLIYELELNRIL